MIKKAGYKPLLLLTKAFTLIGIVILVLILAKNSFVVGRPVHQILLLAISPYVLSALTCIVRKRFFTAQS